MLDDEVDVSRCQKRVCNCIVQYFNSEAKLSSCYSFQLQGLLIRQRLLRKPRDACSPQYQAINISIRKQIYSTGVETPTLPKLPAQNIQILGAINALIPLGDEYQ